MSRNTNALFWILCGAIFVVTVYLIVNTNISSTLKDLFTNNTRIINKTDDGSTPGKPTLKTKEAVADEFTVVFTPTANTSRYRCNFGTEKGSMKNTGIIYIDRDKITCKGSHLVSGTKYYVQLIAQNLDKSTASDIYDITTK